MVMGLVIVVMLVDLLQRVIIDLVMLIDVQKRHKMNLKILMFLTIP